MARYGLGGLGRSPSREALLRRPRRRLPRTRSWTAGSGGLPATPRYRSRRVRPPTGATPRNAWPLDAFGVPVLRIRNTGRRLEGKAQSVDEETDITTRSAADDGKSSNKENFHALSLSRPCDAARRPSRRSATSTRKNSLRFRAGDRWCVQAWPLCEECSAVIAAQSETRPTTVRTRPPRGHQPLLDSPARLVPS